jgi:hypothetical protein
VNSGEILIMRISEPSDVLNQRHQINQSFRVSESVRLDTDFRLAVYVIYVIKNKVTHPKTIILTSDVDDRDIKLANHFVSQSPTNPNMEYTKEKVLIHL